MWQVPLQGNRQQDQSVPYLSALTAATTSSARSFISGAFVEFLPATRTLQKLPDETVIDGEVVALDDSGRPSFNTLQNFGSSVVPIFYYVFDLLILGGRDVRFEALDTRRELLKTKVLSKLHEPIRYSPSLDASLPDLIRSVHDMPKRRALASPATDSKIDYC